MHTSEMLEKLLKERNQEQIAETPELTVKVIQTVLSSMITEFGKGQLLYSSESFKAASLKTWQEFVIELQDKAAEYLKNALNEEVTVEITAHTTELNLCSITIGEKHYQARFGLVPYWTHLGEESLIPDFTAN